MPSTVEIFRDYELDMKDWHHEQAAQDEHEDLLELTFTCLRHRDLVVRKRQDLPRRYYAYQCVEQVYLREKVVHQRYWGEHVVEQTVLRDCEPHYTRVADSANHPDWREPKTQSSHPSWKEERTHQAKDRRLTPHSRLHDVPWIDWKAIMAEIRERDLAQLFESDLVASGYDLTYHEEQERALHELAEEKYFRDLYDSPYEEDLED